MKKTERLFLLLDIVSRQAGISIFDLATALNVSSRTIFRDFRDLKSLGFNIDLKERHAPTDNSPISGIGEFTDLELRLIKFALKTHQLAGVFPFAELAERLNLNSLGVERSNSTGAPEVNLSQKPTKMIGVSITGSRINVNRLLTKIEKDANQK